MMKASVPCEDDELERQVVQEAIEEAMSQDRQDFAAQELLEMSTSQDATFFEHQRLSHPINASCPKLFEEQRLSHGAIEHRSRYGYLVAQAGLPKANLPTLQEFNHMSGWFSSKKKSYQNTFQLKNSKIEVSTKSVTPGGTAVILPYHFHTPKGVEGFERPIGHFKLDHRPKPVTLNPSRNQYPLAKHLLSSPPQAQKDFLTSCLDLTNSAFLRSSIESSARKIEHHQAILSRPAHSPKVDGIGQRSTQTSPKTVTPSHFIFPAAGPSYEDTVPRHTAGGGTDVGPSGAAVVLDDFISELRKLAGSSNDPLTSGIEGRKGPFIEIGSRPTRTKHRAKAHRQEKVVLLPVGEANTSNHMVQPRLVSGTHTSAKRKDKLPVLGTHQTAMLMEPVQEVSRYRGLDQLEYQSAQNTLKRLGTSHQPEHPKSSGELRDSAARSYEFANDYQQSKRLEIGPLNMKLDGLLRHTQLLKSSNVKNIFNQIKTRKTGGSEEKMSKKRNLSDVEPTIKAGPKPEASALEAFRAAHVPLLMQSSELAVQPAPKQSSQTRVSSNLRITKPPSKPAASSDKAVPPPATSETPSHQFVERQKKYRSDLTVSLGKAEGHSLQEESIFRSFEPSPLNPPGHGKLLFVASTPQSSSVNRRIELQISKVTNRPQGGYLRTRRLAEVLTENLRISAAVNNLSHKSAARTTVQTPTAASGWQSSKHK